RSAAALCARHLKPLQAELGGNNAVVVLADFDVETAVREIVASAFSFSGQRCTAPRRLLVQRDIAEKFTGELLAAVDGLRLGDPRDPATVLGPLVSRTHQQTVGAVVEAAVAAGASVLRGGRVPPGMEHGCWYEPTVLSGAPMHSAVVNQETFGPLVVMQEVADLRDAIARCNAVPQGLVATLFSHDPAAQATFREQVQAGILKCNQAPAGVVASAPFGGWKESGLGPPEHGPWDRDFYTRPQALYGFTPS
ncbi:MAG: aldehyde dehydrogenase family protein, partial [Gammaproteobacteria bacterium]|nr:aldehyde dehydrogenase family protein [Gammaproteobacteria bacterium]